MHDIQNSFNVTKYYEYIFVKPIDKNRNHYQVRQLMKARKYQTINLSKHRTTCQCTSTTLSQEIDLTKPHFVKECLSFRLLNQDSVV